MPGRTWPALPAWAGAAALLLAMLVRMGWLDWATSPAFVEACGGVLLALFFTFAFLVVAAVVVGFVVAVLYAPFSACKAAASVLTSRSRPARAPEVAQDA